MKSRRQDYHRWTFNSDIFPFNLKQVNFGDNLNLFLGFLDDWSGAYDHDNLAPNNVEDLTIALLNGEAFVEGIDPGYAKKILETWVFETWTYYQNKDPDEDSKFKTLYPVHLNFARIWPSRYATKSGFVGMKDLYFTLLAYDQNGDIELGLLKKLRSFFSEEDSKEIAKKSGPFPAIVIETFCSEESSENMDEIRSDNRRIMEKRTVAPFCRTHSQAFQDDLVSLMEYADVLAHREVIRWLYSIICFHLVTYSLRVAEALREIMRAIFRYLESDIYDPNILEACENCKDIGTCPFKPIIPVSATDDPGRYKQEPFVEAVESHEGLMKDQPSYLSTLSLLRETSDMSNDLETLSRPLDFVRVFQNNPVFKKKAVNRIASETKNYIRLVNEDEIVPTHLMDSFIQKINDNESSALRIFRQTNSAYYEHVGSNRDSRAQLWSFVRSAAEDDGAGFLMPKARGRPQFYFLSSEILMILCHLLLAMKPSSRLNDLLAFLENRGIILDSTRKEDQQKAIIRVLQELGMYTKMSDDRSAQFLYPLYRPSEEE